ncbi:Crp/Fnr family transcriptional regulator [Palleronia sp. KMU-117]|uniref:Crp/Fnr family transcriptional regulator n=1 Tax=Palleronia sp. KMU-117 TaxID=3434108 RepID=UPI003D7096CF
MDLTLESAFSTGGLVGHFAYLLLVVSMLMRSLFWLRVLVILSALTAIAYAAIWLNDPVSTFWESALVVVNIVQITLEWRANRKARFTAEEQGFIDARLQGLGKFEARRLLDLGTWVDAPVGTRLTTQGQMVQDLIYVSSGTVAVFVGGRRVATCAPGSFVGEMSLVGGGPASATTEVETPTRHWAIPLTTVLRLRDQNSRLVAALEVAIAHDLKSKVIAANLRTA